MTIQATAATNAFMPVQDAAHNRQDRRQAFRDLSKAMDQQDLGAAQQAYASLAKTMPANKTDTPFAQLGQALQAGDMTAAHTAYDAMLPNRVKQALPADPVRPAPSISTTGGVAGSRVSISV